MDEEGAAAIGKPVGTYLSLDLTACWRREPGSFPRAAAAVASLLTSLVPEEGPVLVAGLGNAAMTADALGPRTAGHLLVTRHLGAVLPMLRPVAALAAGVLGQTGLEVAEWVRGAAERVEPAAVIVVDALAARSLERLCATVQISDTGLIPGSGVGNHRMALNRETLGVPCSPLGCPQWWTPPPWPMTFWPRREAASPPSSPGGISSPPTASTRRSPISPRSWAMGSAWPSSRGWNLKIWRGCWSDLFRLQRRGALFSLAISCDCSPPMPLQSRRVGPWRPPPFFYSPTRPA